MTPAELGLLRSYADGPRIWDAASLQRTVGALADKGLIEPVPDPERPGAYRLTGAGRQALDADPRLAEIARLRREGGT